MSHQITLRQAERILVDNGYKKDRIRGGHIHYVNAEGNRIVVNTGLHHLVWRRIVKENNLQVD